MSMAAASIVGALIGTLVAHLFRPRDEDVPNEPVLAEEQTPTRTGRWERLCWMLLPVIGVWSGILEYSLLTSPFLDASQLFAVALVGGGILGVFCFALTRD